MSRAHTRPPSRLRMVVEAVTALAAEIVATPASRAEDNRRNHELLADKMTAAERARKGSNR